MSNAENKVQFNLKNVHYAKRTEADGVISFAKPVAVPGAVTLTLDPQGELTKFYADGIVYYQGSNNNGYSGDLEMARFVDQMLQDIWNYMLDSNKVLVESAEEEFAEFALLFQIDGDKDNDCYCLYKCSGTRPGIGGQTNTETKEPKTQSSTISAVPDINGRVMARTTAATSDTIRSGWFSEVYEPAVTAAES